MKFLAPVLLLLCGFPAAAEPRMPTASEIADSKRKMESVAERFEFSRRSIAREEPAAAERKILIGEILGALRRTDEIQLQVPEAAGAFDLWYPPRRAFSSLIAYAERKPVEEASAILGEIYRECDPGIGILYRELAPALVRVELRRLFSDEAFLLAPLPVSNERIPPFLEETPESLRSCWKLARAFEEVRLELPSREDSTRGLLNYQESAEIYYTLMAHSVVRGQWQDAYAIANCSWGNGCGVGADAFTTERSAYALLVALSDPVSRRSDNDRTALLLRALVAADPTGAPLFSVPGHEPGKSGFDQAVREKDVIPRGWQTLAIERLNRDVSNWPELLAGVLLFGSGELADSLSHWFSTSLPLKIGEIACLAVEKGIVARENLNVEALDRILPARVSSDPLARRLADAMSTRATEIDDPAQLERFVNRLAQLEGEESTRALLAVAHTGGNKAAGIAKGELDIRGVSFPENTRAPGPVGPVGPVGAVGAVGKPASSE